MAGTEIFGTHHDRYDAWFEEHAAAYVSELLALRPFVPIQGRGLEIGVGTGRFAVPLGIGVGVDPSAEMLRIASARGVDVVEGVAERLPFAEDSFDHVLVVTAICFVDSPAAMMSEARRVLRPGGTLVIGFVDHASALGRDYEAHKSESVFYRDATFFSADEVEDLLGDAGFTITDRAQTLSRSLAETIEVEPVEVGHGKYAFVVVAARNDK